MANFCTNCGAKLRKEDNFCSNCGAKVNRTNIEQNNHLSKSDRMEKEQAKKELKKIVGGILFPNKTFSNELFRNGLSSLIDGKAIRLQVEKEIDSGQIKSGGVEFRVNQLIQEYKLEKEKEKAKIAEKKEEEKKKLKMIDEIFESEEIKSEIRENNIDQIYVNAIKDSLKKKIINERENMIESEIKFFIKTRLKKVSREQRKARLLKEIEMRNKKIEKTKTTNGGYCSINCRHYYEEFLDSEGAITGDYDSEGYVEYYCHLGHPILDGYFCEDYE